MWEGWDLPPLPSSRVVLVRPSPVALHCTAADPLRTFKVLQHGRSSSRPPGGSRCLPLRERGGRRRRRRNTSAGKVSCTSSSRERPPAVTSVGAAVLLAAVGAAYQSTPASFLIPRQQQHSLLPTSPSPTITDHVRIRLRRRRNRRRRTGLISESSKQRGRTEGGTFLRPPSPPPPLLSSLLLVVSLILICRSLRCGVDNRGEKDTSSTPHAHSLQSIRRPPIQSELTRPAGFFLPSLAHSVFLPR